MKKIGRIADRIYRYEINLVLRNFDIVLIPLTNVTEFAVVLF